MGLCFLISEVGQGKKSLCEKLLMPWKSYWQHLRDFGEKPHSIWKQFASNSAVPWVSHLVDIINRLGGVQTRAVLPGRFGTSRPHRWLLVEPEISMRSIPAAEWWFQSPEEKIVLVSKVQNVCARIVWAWCGLRFGSSWESCPGKKLHNPE